MSLKLGLQAVEEQQYTRAVDLLEYFCQNCFDYKSQEYIQAKIGLATAYYGLGQREQVVYICQELIRSDRLSVRQWAQQWLNSIQAIPKYTTEELKSIFNQGRQALKQKNYPAAIKFLEEYCQHNHQPELPENQQAKMGLIQSYTGTKDFKAAITLCEEMDFSHDPLIRGWVKEKLPTLRAAQNRQKKSKYDSDATYIENPILNTEEEKLPENPPGKLPEKRQPNIYAQATIKANYLNKRATQSDIKLKMPKIGGNLTLAIIITLITIILSFFLPLFGVIWFINQTFSLTNLSVIFLFSLCVSLIINVSAFWLSPRLLDTVWEKVYSPRWVPLSEIRYYSPEATEIIERICQEHKFKTPRLGIINNPTPAAFSYGCLRNHSRIMVTQGLFSYLDEDETATVYAYELGNIVNGDCTIITIGYLILASIMLLSLSVQKSRENQRIVLANFIYTFTTYSLFYLSRIRAYYGDHFASEVTGNPNALIRALNKIAHGLVDENERSQQRTNLLTQTRALGIYDPDQEIGITTSEKNLGKIITWELVNPWGNSLELNTTHPLTGRRIKALTNYGEQLGLQIEANFNEIIAEAQKLNLSKLRNSFVGDCLGFYSPAIAIVAGLLIALVLYLTGQSVIMFLSTPLLSYGFAKLIKHLLMYPYKQKVTETDVLNLFSSPYTSALRSDKVKLSGELLSNQPSHFCLQDETGLIQLRYFPLQSHLPVGSKVRVTGWFRRGIPPYLDVIEVKTQHSHDKTTYYLANLSLGLGAIVLALLFFWL